MSRSSFSRRSQGGQISNMTVLVQQNLPGHLRKIRHDAQDRLCGNALAAARFADNTQGTVLVNRERYTVHRFQQPLFQGKVGVQISEFQDRLLLFHCRYL